VRLRARQGSKLPLFRGRVSSFLQSEPAVFKKKKGVYRSLLGRGKKGGLAKERKVFTRGWERCWACPAKTFTRFLERKVLGLFKRRELRGLTGERVQEEERRPSSSGGNEAGEPAKVIPREA